MGQCSSSTRQQEAVIQKPTSRPRKHEPEQEPPPPVTSIVTKSSTKHRISSKTAASSSSSSSKRLARTTSSSTRRSATSRTTATSATLNHDLERKIRRKSRAASQSLTHNSPASSSATTPKPPLSEIRRSRRNRRASAHRAEHRSLPPTEDPVPPNPTVVTEVEVPYTPEPIVVMMREPDILNEQQNQRLQKLLLQKQQEEQGTSSPSSSDADDPTRESRHLPMRSSSRRSNRSRRSHNSWGGLTFDGDSSVSGSSCNGYDTPLRMNDWDEIKHFVDSMDDESVLDIQDAVYCPRHADPFAPPAKQDETRRRDPPKMDGSHTDSTRSMSMGSSHHTNPSQYGLDDTGPGVEEFLEQDIVLLESQQDTSMRLEDLVIAMQQETERNESVEC